MRTLTAGLMNINETQLTLGVLDALANLSERGWAVQLILLDNGSDRDEVQVLRDWVRGKHSALFRCPAACSGHESRLQCGQELHAGAMRQRPDSVPGQRPCPSIGCRVVGGVVAYHGRCGGRRYCGPGAGIRRSPRGDRSGRGGIYEKRAGWLSVPGTVHPRFAAGRHFRGRVTLGLLVGPAGCTTSGWLIF